MLTLLIINCEVSEKFQEEQNSLTDHWIFVTVSVSLNWTTSVSKETRKVKVVCLKKIIKL